ALQDPEARVRQKAVEVLGNIGPADPAVGPALSGALKDRAGGVRRAALLALLKCGPAAREAIPALTEAPKDPDALVRPYAAQALERVQGNRNGRQSVPAAP